MLSIFLSSLTHGGCRPTQRQPPNSKTVWAKIVRTRRRLTSCANRVFGLSSVLPVQLRFRSPAARMPHVVISYLPSVARKYTLISVNWNALVRVEQGYGYEGCKPLYPKKGAFMEETWKTVAGFHGKYFASSIGRVKNKNGLIIRQRIQKKRGGYAVVDLWDNSKRYCKRVHRLVAEAFLCNPNHYKEVNHKDENSSNNCVENLEWCSSKYNCNYGSRIRRIGKKLSKPVAQIKDGKVVAVWESIRAAHKAGYTRDSIFKCCNGKYKQHKGFQWKYV